jgi:hypothetical protein
MSELGSTNSGRDSTREQGNASSDSPRAPDGPSPSTDNAGRTATIEKPAEALTRGEYDEQIRRGPAAGADDPATNESVADGREAKDQSADRGALAEPLTRGEYRKQIRQGSAAEGDNPDEAAPEVGKKEPRGDGTVTQFHSEFKGETLDLYTDGTRWATIDHPRREDTVTVKPDVPDRLPTGTELVEGAGEDAPLAERLRRELYEESDDELDVLEKGTNLVHDVFSHEPTGSYESTPASHPFISEAQPSAIDPGSMATALFTLGLVIDRGLRWGMRHYKEGSKRR